MYERGILLKKNIKMAQKIAERVSRIGGRAYYVGGFVRDELMGLNHNDKAVDIDIEIHGVPQEELYAILAELGEPISMGKSFGIMALRGYNLDIALPRTEKKIGNLHTDFDVKIDEKMGTFNASKRRDFTINAIMKDALTGEVIDHFGGLKDIENKVIRHISNESFVEDPLRVLRACSFASRFEFEIAQDTLDLCKSMDIKLLSKERIFGELVKLFEQANKPSIFFRELDKMEHLEYWFKELYETKFTEQSSIYHAEGSVFEHTMLVLDVASSFKDRAKQPINFLFAALCHDLGKNVTTKKIDGDIKAPLHEIEGMDLAKTFLKRFTNNKKLIQYVVNMVCLHMSPVVHFFKNSEIEKTNTMFDKSVEPEDLIYLSIADNLGRVNKATPYDSKDFLFERLQIYNEVMAKDYVKGSDLIASGIKPDESFKEILEYAHKLRLAGVDKDTCLKQVLAYLKH